jgi:hypothetical protein
MKNCTAAAVEMIAADAADMNMNMEMIADAVMTTSMD